MANVAATGLFLRQARATGTIGDALELHRARIRDADDAVLRAVPAGVRHHAHVALAELLVVAGLAELARGAVPEALAVFALLARRPHIGGRARCAFRHSHGLRR